MKKWQSRCATHLRYVLACVGLLAGCQSYVAKPVDVEAMLAAWRGRTPAMARPDQGSSDEGFDPSDGLDADEGAIVALALNPELNRSRRRAAIDDAGLEHVSPLSNPVVGADLHRVAADVPNGWKLRGSIGFVIPLSGRRGAEQALARATAQASALRVGMTEWTLDLRVRRAWADWSAVARKLEVLRAYGRAMEPLHRTAGALSKAGELGATRVAVLGLDRIERELEASELTEEASRLRQELLALMGLRPNAPVVLHPLRKVAPPVRSPAKEHPRVRAALARYEVAEQRVRREIAKQYPDLTIGPSYELDEGQSAIGLGLGIPIPVFNLNRLGIARARAAREAARADVAAAIEGLATERALVRGRLERHEARAKRLQSRLLPAVEAQLGRLARLARDGELDPLLVQHFLGKARQASLALVDAELEGLRAGLTLRALGEGPR